MGALRWGSSVAALYHAAAIRTPTRAAVVDHLGSLSFAQLDSRSTDAAHGLVSLGLRPSDHVGVLCRNHRDFVEATVATAKAGLTPVYLNTGSAGPELDVVLEREGIKALFCDADLLATVEATSFAGDVVVTDGDGPTTMQEIQADDLARAMLGPRAATPPVMLTSGTTGVPKGAHRSARFDPRAALALFEQIPYQVGDVFLIASPVFHAWGLSQLMLAAALGSTCVLTTSTDPQELTGLIEEHSVTALAVVPITLQRILSIDSVDCAQVRSLRIVASSGSELRGDLATAWMDFAGDNLYNLYGSTEVGLATVATPTDLRETPGTAGRVLPGTVVRILDAAGAVAESGSAGQIYVRSGSQLSHYTGGATREVDRWPDGVRGRRLFRRGGPTMGDRPR